MAVFGEWEQVRVEIMPEMKKLELFFDHEGEKCKLEVMFVDILASFSCCLGGVESNTILLQDWWLLKNKVELTKAAAIANCLVFFIGYQVFRGANRQKHIFKKDPKALIWGKPPKVIGGKLLASGYWGIARHCNYLGDLLLALSFSLPCGISSAIPYFYPTYLFILLIWRERRDEARCSQKYKEIWTEYCKLVPWRILPYVY